MSVTAIQSSFVIVNANTSEMEIYFNGDKVEGVQDLKIDWDKQQPKVIITLNETDLVNEMKTVGIQVRRSA